MNKRKHKTDYQIIADHFGVSVFAVKRALERRDDFPNNRLVKAYDKLQAAKEKAISKIKTVEKMKLVA